MKNSLLIIVLLFVSSISLLSQSKGELDVTFTTTEKGGEYAPRHVIAVWVEDDYGNFVKTLMAYADMRMTHLNTWEAITTSVGSAFNTVDAVTGATQYVHEQRSCTWDGSNFQDVDVEDGKYKVFMELTDENRTGNVSSFTFTKGGSSQQLTPEDVPSFKKISINWTPEEAASLAAKDYMGWQIFPNPSTGVFQTKSKEDLNMKVWNVSGELVDEQRGVNLNLSAQPDGLYILNVSDGEKSSVELIVKKSL